MNNIDLISTDRSTQPILKNMVSYDSCCHTLFRNDTTYKLAHLHIPHLHNLT